MPHKSHAEIMGNVPIETGDTPGQPAGVKGIIDTENVTGPIHNRSLDSIIKNADLNDLSMRRQIAVPRKLSKTSVGDAFVDLTGLIYTGESSTEDKASALLKLFRVTDPDNNPLFVNDEPVIVDSILDGSGLTSPVGATRQIALSASGGVTFELQTITHVDATAPLSFGQPGDLIAVAGGTPNDGTYVLEEVLGALSCRVRTQTGNDPAFQAGTYTGTVELTTDGYFTHRKDGGETFDVRCNLTPSIPASEEYVIHYYEGVQIKELERRHFVDRDVLDRPYQPHGIGEVFFNAISPFAARLPADLGDTLVGTERGALTLQQEANALSQYGATLATGGYEVGVPGTRQLAEVNTYRNSNVGGGRTALEFVGEHSDLSVLTGYPGKISDQDIHLSDTDLSDIGGGIVQEATRNFVADGVTEGMSIYIDGDPTLYIITEVAPGAANNRLTLDKAPPPFSNQSFTIFSRNWLAETNPVIYPGTFGVARLDLPSGQGDVTKGSTEFTDAAKNFTSDQVQVGDLLYLVDPGINNRRPYVITTVAPGGDNTKLEVDGTFVETETGLEYIILSPTFMAGRAFYVTNVYGHELTVQMLNDVTSAWPIDRVGLINIEFFNISSMDDNFLEDASANDYLGRKSSKLIPIQGRPGVSIVPGIHIHPMLSSDFVLEDSLVQNSRFRPGDETKGLTLYGGDWVYIGDPTDNYVESMRISIGDYLYPLEGSEAGVQFTVMEVCGPVVKLFPTPTFTTNGNRQLRFYIEKADNLSFSMDGRIVAKDIFLGPVNERAYPMPIGNYDGADGNLAAFGTYAGFYSNKVSWVAEQSLDLRHQDELHRIVSRCVLDSGPVSNPNSAFTQAFITQRLDNNDAFVSHTLAAPYITGTASFTTGSRVVSGLSGLLGAVYPGCYVTIAGSEALEIAHVLDDNVLVLAEDHAQGTSTPSVTVTNGFPTDLLLPSQLWVFVSCLTSPYQYEDAQPTMNYYSLGGPNNTDIIIGSRYIARTNRTI